MTVLHDEIVTREVQIIRSCVWWKAESVMRGAICGRGHTFGRDKNMHIPNQVQNQNTNKEGVANSEYHPSVNVNVFLHLASAVHKLHLKPE